MKIEYKKKFKKSYQKMDKKQRTLFQEKLKIFIRSPEEKSLRNHFLQGEYYGFKSINISGDMRAIFKEYGESKYEFVDFIDIGTHSQLYK